MSKRKKSGYNNHLHADDPLEAAPKTTKWRLKRKIKQAETTTFELENGFEDAEVCEDSELGLPNADPTQNDEIIGDASSSGACNESKNVVFDCSGKDEQNEWFEVFNEDSAWYNCENDEASFPQQSDEKEFTYEDHEDNDDNEKPIYNGASITLAQSAILILSFALRHNITGECLADLLTLISLHCLATNIIHKSLYQFKAYFSNLKAPLKFHKYCANCEFLLKETTERCPVCDHGLNEKNSVSYFVEIPLVYQIEQLFKRTGFHQMLLHKFSRTKKHPDNTEDIYDGELYRKYSKSGDFLNNKNNISFMWYTDGVPLFKSSKISIWPIFLAINELPCRDRMKQENMIFLGMWFGKSKPAMSTFLKPFHDTLKHFQQDGIQVDCSHCECQIIVRGMLLCGTCDLPAKCIVMNMMQFNGKYGCPKCKQEGNVIKTGNGHTRVFPFDAALIDGPKRSHSEFVSNGEDAFATSTPIFGVKGPSWWVNINTDIINGTAIDYMHTVLLGIVRRLLLLWFDPKFSAEQFSVSNHVEVADRRLLSIKPPYFIHRHPRSIKDHAQYWKASECRAWLFFYSVPVMFGILKKEIFQHYLLLVESIFILNLDSISHDQLLCSEELLIKFCCLFSVLYGEKHMSANLHQILHLPDTVKQLGPLWVYSCFAFESMNGKLIKLFHGTQNCVVQIANAVSALLKLPVLADQIKKESTIGYFYCKLTSTKYHYTTTETISNGIYMIGGQRLCNLEAKYQSALALKLKNSLGKCYIFYRILLNGVLYQCVKYNANYRNSYTVMYSSQSTICCWQILYFVKCYPLCPCKIDQCHCFATCMAIILKIDLDEECIFTQGNADLIKSKLPNIRSGKVTNICIAVPVQDIIELVVSANIANQKLSVSLRPNNIESD